MCAERRLRVCCERTSVSSGAFVRECLRYLCERTRATHERTCLVRARHAAVRVCVCVTIHICVRLRRDHSPCARPCTRAPVTMGHDARDTWRQSWQVCGCIVTMGCVLCVGRSKKGQSSNNVERRTSTVSKRVSTASRARSAPVARGDSRGFAVPRGAPPRRRRRFTAAVWWVHLLCAADGTPLGVATANGERTKHSVSIQVVMRERGVDTSSRRPPNGAAVPWRDRWVPWGRNRDRGTAGLSRAVAPPRDTRERHVGGRHIRRRVANPLVDVRPFERGRGNVGARFNNEPEPAAYTSPPPPERSSPTSARVILPPNHRPPRCLQVQPALCAPYAACTLQLCAPMRRAVQSSAVQCSTVQYCGVFRSPLHPHVLCAVRLQPAHRSPTHRPVLRPPFACDCVPIRSDSRVTVRP